MRIWYQSFLDPAVHTAYLGPLRAYLDQVADPGVEFVLGGLRPADRGLSRLDETRCAIQAVEHVVLAERAGFDAVLVGHFQEPGLEDARCAVDIPVIGMGEASMLWAGTLGRGFGLVTIDPVYRDWHARQAERCGLAGRLAGVTALEGFGVEGMVAAFAGGAPYQRFHDAFCAAAAPLVRDGAEVIIPAGGLPAMLCSRQRGMRIDGAAVLNPVLVSAKAAELAVKLATLDGLGCSRVRSYPRAPAVAVQDLLDLAAPTSDPALRPSAPG